MTELRHVIALILAATALTGCIGFIEPDYLLPAKRMEKVREAAEMYGEYLRFGRIPEAASFVRNEDREAFLQTFLKSTRRLEFTSAEIVTVESVSPMVVEVWTQYELFAPPSVEIRTLSERQKWHYDPLRRSWRVQPDLAVFPGSPPAAEPSAAAAS